jgi:branched-chain amino acid transport system ATP-binding protein
MEGRRVFEDLTVEENLVAATYALTGRKPEAPKPDFDLVYTYFPRLHERRNGLAGYLSGRRAADAGHRPRAHRPAPAHPARRALAGPLAQAGRRHLHHHRAHQCRARRVSMLLVEQNATVALAVAHSGYIMENGKIVIDGRPSAWPTTPTCASSTSAWAAAAKRKASATSSITSAASAGCPESMHASDAHKSLTLPTNAARARPQQP